MSRIFFNDLNYKITYWLSYNVIHLHTHAYICMRLNVIKETKRHLRYCSANNLVNVHLCQCTNVSLRVPVGKYNHQLLKLKRHLFSLSIVPSIVNNT